MVLALVLGLFQLILSALLKSRRSLYSGLICAAFAVSVSSPVIHRLITTGVVPFYNLEIFCRYAVYGLAALLVTDLCRESRKWKRHLQTSIAFIAAVFPFLALAVSLMAPELTRNQMILFSRAAGWYKILCSLWLLGAVFYAGLCQEQKLDISILLAGICALASSLAADRIYPGFEPIRFGWFSETAGLLFVLFISFLMLRDSAALYRQQFLFVQQKKLLENQISMQKNHYAKLAGQMELIRVMRHDIRHHLNRLSVLLSDGEYTAAGEYIAGLTKNTFTDSPLSFCDAYSVDVLLRFYDSKARELKVPFTVNAHVPKEPGIPAEDLCVILGNLLENGLEASLRLPPASRQMSVTMTFENKVLAVEVKNCCAGGPSLDSGSFAFSKKTGRPGIGLSSVRQTAEKYGGNVWIRTQEGENGVPVFLVQALLLTGETQTILNKQT